MSAIPYEDHDQHWETQDEEFTLPGRRRRRLLNRKSAALIAVITCAAGFYAGIRIEKGQLANSTGSPNGSRPGSTSGIPSGGRFPGLGSGSSTPSIGTIAAVNGNTIYLTETSGNTIKVKLSSATKVSKSQTVSKHSLHPGDSVVIQGLKASSGTISATSVSDSGATNTSRTTSNSSGGNSAVSSLFGSGSGG